MEVVASRPPVGIPPRWTCPAGRPALPPSKSHLHECPLPQPNIPFCQRSVAPALPLRKQHPISSCPEKAPASLRTGPARRPSASCFARYLRRKPLVEYLHTISFENYRSWHRSDLDDLANLIPVS